jgi:post-segregation antitoxin (ccd killing protein)
MTDTDSDRTVTEQAVIEEVAEDRGEEWTEEHAAPIVAQARLVGEL